LKNSKAFSLHGRASFASIDKLHFSLCARKIITTISVALDGKFQKYAGRQNKDISLQSLLSQNPKFSLRGRKKLKSIWVAFFGKFQNVRCAAGISHVCSHAC
jgi:hypothetical protein